MRPNDDLLTFAVSEPGAVIDRMDTSVQQNFAEPRTDLSQNFGKGASTRQAQQRSKGYIFYCDVQLIARSVRDETERELWLRHIAQFLDTNGAGWVYVDDLFKTAKRLYPGFSKLQFDRYIKSGLEAGYWYRLGRQRRRGETDYRRKLHYTAYTTIQLQGAGRDGTNWAGAPLVQIPLRWSKYLPMAYAGWFNVLIDAKSRDKDVIGGKKRSKRLKVVSISRQSIEDVWGISAPTQIKWEKTAGINVNRSQVQADEKINLSELPEHATPYKTLDGKEQWFWWGVNTYAPPRMKVSKSKRTRLTMRRQYRKALAGGVESSAQPLSEFGQEVSATADMTEGTQRPFETTYHDYRKPKDAFDAVKKLESGRQKRAKNRDIPTHEHQVMLGARNVVAVRQRVTTTPAQTTPLQGIDWDAINDPEWQARRLELIETVRHIHAQYR